MPYNNNPIPPSDDVTGTISLPLARVKKIIHADDDVQACSNNAAFTIAVATELFVQHLVEQAQAVVKSERRPRRNLQYRDIANAVARVDNLEFLSDVVPRTVPYKAYKAGRDAAAAAASSSSNNPSAGAPGPPSANETALPNGQKTLLQMQQGSAAAGAARINEDGEDADMEDAAAATDGASFVSAHSRGASRTSIGSGGRGNFDAVRNGFDGRMDVEGMNNE